MCATLHTHTQCTICEHFDFVVLFTKWSNEIFYIIYAFKKEFLDSISQFRTCGWKLVLLGTLHHLNCTGRKNPVNITFQSIEVYWSITEKRSEFQENAALHGVVSDFVFQHKPSSDSMVIGEFSLSFGHFLPPSHQWDCPFCYSSSLSLVFPLPSSSQNKFQIRLVLPADFLYNVHAIFLCVCLSHVLESSSKRAVYTASGTQTT